MKLFAHLLVVLLLALTVQHASAQQVDLHDDLDTYYRNHNVAFALSTSAERAGLAQYSSAAEAVRETGSERLGRVYRALQTSSSYLVAVDPGMVVSPDPKGVQEEADVPRLFEVEKVHRAAPNKMYVRVMGARLGPQDVLHFIRRFEGESDDPPLEEEIARRGLVPHPEVHTWIKRDARWYRMQPYVQFLGH